MWAKGERECGERVGEELGDRGGARVERSQNICCCCCHGDDTRLATKDDRRRSHSRVGKAKTGFDVPSLIYRTGRNSIKATNAETTSAALENAMDDHMDR